VESVLRGEAGVTVDEPTAFNALYWLVVTLAGERRLTIVVDDHCSTKPDTSAHRTLPSTKHH
jgi:hypothetical protein